MINRATQAYLSQFLQTRLSLHGQPLTRASLMGTLSEVRRELSPLIHLSSSDRLRTCLLKDSDPIRLSLSFFLFLDHGICPIMVPSTLCPFQWERLQNLGHACLEDGQFQPARPETQPQEIPQVLSYACLTSGTTSDPKLCWLSVEGALKNAKAHVESIGLTPEHTLIQMLPLYHSFGIVCYLWTHYYLQGALDFNQHVVNLKSLAQLTAQTDGPICLYTSPSHLQFLIKDQARGQFPAIKHEFILSVGGGIAKLSDILSLRLSFPYARFFVTYGLTEAGPRVSTAEIHEQNIESYRYASGAMGTPIRGVDIKLLNERHELVDRGIGRLCLRSPSLKLNIKPTELWQGYYVAQDIVEIIEGQLFFRSRKDHLIKVGGLSVYPQDIEQVAKTFPQVVDCIVLPLSHPLYGEVPHLLIEGECDQVALLNYLKQRLSLHQIPKKISIISQFPRHSLNKVNIPALMQQLQPAKGEKVHVTAML